MLTQNGWLKLKKLLMKHEGLSLVPYHCPTGFLTIGYGRNLEAQGITRGEAMMLLQNDVHKIYSRINDNLDFFYILDENRKIVLIEMAYNLGFHGMLEFKKMLLALENQDYKTAAKEMLDSRWATQVGQRAIELAEIMKTGTLI